MIVQEGDRIRADVGANVTAYIEGTVVGAEQDTGHVLIETEQGGAVFLPPEKIKEVLDRASVDESEMYDKPMTQMSAPSRERAEEIADGMVEDGYEVVYVAELRNEWADDHDRWCIFFDRELRRSPPVTVRSEPTPEKVERARGCMMAVLDGCSVSGDEFRRNLNVLLDATEPDRK